MERPYRGPRPSLFFPILLITIGVVWLLINNGYVASANLYQLIPFWPVLLIVAGLSLILERIWWPLGGLLWLLAAGLFLWLLIAPPAFIPAAPGAELKSETFSEPIGEARSASIDLDLSTYPTDVFANEGSDDLIVAILDYTGDVVFDVSGTTEKTVRLDHNFGMFVWGLGQGLLSGREGRWEIGLAPGVPMDLRVDVGTGRANIDLSGLSLESLVVDGGTGSMEIVLPEGEEPYTFDLDVGTGSTSVQIQRGAALEMTVDGGTGSLVIDVPDDAGVQVEVEDGGTGSLRLPAGFDKVQEGDDNDEGVWENEAYASSDSPIQIVLDIGTGGVNVR